MTGVPTTIIMSEWETRVLDGRVLDPTPGTNRVVELLDQSQMLGISELRRGLQIKTFSHVGRLRIGNLNVTILPKLKGASLLGLIRYAYGFRRLNLVSQSQHFVEHSGFDDLLIAQLNAEVHELWSRGFLRSYISTDERLSSPRGRIDLNRMALDGGTVTATLPCQHHPRIEDTPLNQVILAGLRLAASMASVVELQRDSARLASFMEEQVSSIRLNTVVLNRASDLMNRLTAAYAPALSIIRLLFDAQGVVLEGQTTSTSLPGFLFDMNAFFQALLSRFLRENLEGFEVQDERGLRGMMRYNSQFNPQRQKSPTPRPDYVVMKGKTVCSILDAKYRDLWEKNLPREMLYQLVVYAISDEQRRSSILYPTMVRAKEARIDIADPVHGKHLGQVCLRPVRLQEIETLIGGKTAQARRDRADYARWLAFGSR